MTMVSHGSSELFEMSKYLMLGALLTALIQTFVAQDSLSCHRTRRLHLPCVHDGLRLPALLMLNDRCLRGCLLRQVILTWLPTRLSCIRPHDRREEHTDDAFDLQGPFCLDTIYCRRHYCPDRFVVVHAFLSGLNSQPAIVRFRIIIPLCSHILQNASFATLH